MDFGRYNWTAYGLDIDMTLVFIDDHMDAYRRMFTGNPGGFRHFILAENFPYLKGDAQSLEAVCEVKRKSAWPGYVKDNYGNTATEMTCGHHLMQSENLKESIKHYYEFPPIAVGRFVGKIHVDRTGSSTAIVNNPRKFYKLFGDVNMREFAAYNHIAYAEILP